jgi:hypothetical protein
VRDGDGGQPVHHGDLEPAAAPPGDTQGVRRPRHRPQPPRRRALRPHLLRRPDGLRPLPHLRHRDGRQPHPHQGTRTHANPLAKLNQPSSQQPPPPKPQQTLTHDMLFASASPGDGDGAAARQRLLVPPDPQDGQVQARQEQEEEAAAVRSPRGQARHRLNSGDRTPATCRSHRSTKLSRRRIRSWIRSETECCTYIPVVCEVLASDHVNMLCPLARVSQTGGECTLATVIGNTKLSSELKLRNLASANKQVCQSDWRVALHVA